MGQTTESVIREWVKAAGEARVSRELLEKIILAGEFMRDDGNQSAEKILNHLSGIDFNSKVERVVLPKGVYIQYMRANLGNWFTKTGLTQDAVGLAEDFRTRELFEPAGDVAALACRAKSIRDNWSADKLFLMNEL